MVYRQHAKVLGEAIPGHEVSVGGIIFQEQALQDSFTEALDDTVLRELLRCYSS